MKLVFQPNNGAVQNMQFFPALIIGSVQEFHGIISIILFGVFQSIHDGQVFFTGTWGDFGEFLNSGQRVIPRLNSQSVVSNMFSLSGEFTLIFFEFLEVAHFSINHILELIDSFLHNNGVFFSIIFNFHDGVSEGLLFNSFVEHIGEDINFNVSFIDISGLDIRNDIVDFSFNFSGVGIFFVVELFKSRFV